MAAATIKFDQLLFNNYLNRAIAEFSTNPLSARLIRRIANDLPELFVAVAVRYLDTSDQSTAHHFLANQMLRQESVFEEIADPRRGPLTRSLNLFNRLWRVDPCFDVKLAQKLPDRTGHNHSVAFDRARSCRALDVLNETSVGRRLVPIVGHLVESADKMLAAKATLFIGRRMQSPQWAARQIMRDNPEEVRAIAVESLWGVKSQSARELLEDCTTDESVRVAGNALVGLHKLGKPGVIEQVTGMVTAETAEHRTTAAWAMGRIGDAAFADPLTGLLRDESPEVRRAALHSLLHLRKPEAATPDPAPGPTPPTPSPELVPERPAPRVVEMPERDEPATPFVDMDIRLDGSAHSTRSDRFRR